MRTRLPELNEKRIIKRFALFPITAGNYRVWLENCTIEQKYLRGEGWRNQRFIFENKK